MEKLLKIEPSKNEIYYPRYNESVLSKPFFHVIFTEKIKKADIFSKRLKKLKVRAGYLRPLTIYDFKIEGLYFVDIFLPFPRLT